MLCLSSILVSCGFSLSSSDGDMMGGGLFLYSFHKSSFPLPFPLPLAAFQFRNVWQKRLILRGSFSEKIEDKKKIPSSPAGNRTPVSRVTGGDTHHYTTEDLDGNAWIKLMTNSFGETIIWACNRDAVFSREETWRPISSEFCARVFASPPL